MGVLGTPKDGFEATLAPLVAAVPHHATQVAGMDEDIAAAAFKPGVISSTIYGPIGTAIAALAKVGDAQLADFTKSVTNVTTTPPPSSGGGGGGGIGGGGGGGQSGVGGYGGQPPVGGGAGGDLPRGPYFHNLEAQHPIILPTRKPRPGALAGK
jgi:hypothetical protein